MSDRLQLTDLIDVETLQNVQDAFSEFTGMAALTTDAEGKPLTKGSNFTDFCIKYSRSSEVGRLRCEQCDKRGAMETLFTGKPTTYYCHAGLIDYSAPIMADGELIGCFIGGQVLTKEPDKETMFEVAKSINVNPDELYAAAKQINILSKETITHAAHSLYVFANILSDMAYSRHLAINAGHQIEQAANMKSDFLANMSHEIRTPMNAVIGMAEMALREDLPPAAREYISQIKSSGKALLTIINDILDFSKIESGKMDITVAEYEPTTIINEVANILMTRLKGKDVELTLSIDPNMASKLLGDSIRIKQVLLNIANNAIKFTQTGNVHISVSESPLLDMGVTLKMSVTDTGIGIKEDDIDKIFQSFQQVDSKRNRNIEGTGLGLAISKQLVTLMNGDIQVESEYGKGSTFSFSLPQRIIDRTPVIKVDEPDKLQVVSYIDNPYIRQQLEEDCNKLHVAHEYYTDVDTLKRLCDNDKLVFLIADESLFTPDIPKKLSDCKSIRFIVLTGFDSTLDFDNEQIIVVKKPLYAYPLSLLLNGEDLNISGEDAVFTDFDFTAPDANVLIVDDNDVNLTVTKGLIEPLNMKIDTALSGKEAIHMISTKHYDIIFMDHMMPELDGVETTQIIRNFHPEYNDVPIIALTANAVDGTKELFLSEGMNDFVAKPIEIRALVSKVKNWLPPEKIKVSSVDSKKKKEKPSTTNLVIDDLDTAYALKLLGSEQLYMSVLKDYYKLIEKKAKYIKQLEETENWPAYTIEVHALKSSSKQIGATSLSDKAAKMEIAGNAGDAETIHRYTDEMLSQYLRYTNILKPLFSEETNTKAAYKEIDIQQLLGFFGDMKEATANLDIDSMEKIIEEMNTYSYPDEQAEIFAKLKEAVDGIDVDTCDEIIHTWEDFLQNT